MREKYKNEWDNSKRLAFSNEELQWKLEQNKEVWKRVMEQSDGAIDRSVFNPVISNNSLNRTQSFREHSSRSFSVECGKR